MKFDKTLLLYDAFFKRIRKFSPHGIKLMHFLLNIFISEILQTNMNPVTNNEYDE